MNNSSCLIIEQTLSIYYKTLGLNDEDLSLNYIKFFDEIEIISHDSSFHLLKKLISKNLAVLMSICLEIDFSGNFKLKYYCKIKDEFSIEKILKCFPKHEHQVLYLNLINDYSDLKLETEPLPPKGGRFNQRLKPPKVG